MVQASDIIVADAVTGALREATPAMVTARAPAFWKDDEGLWS
jgi:hypothetical protein